MAQTPSFNRPELTIDATYTQAFAYDASGNVQYVGRAEPGVATSGAHWQIQKLTYDGSNRITAVQWAQGTDEFKYVWTDRATYTYS
jgi:YD repeat-containing protein